MKRIKRSIIILLCAILFVTIFYVLIMFINHEMNADGLPVIGYHSVVSDEEKENKYADNIYVMSVSEFEKQMKYLSDHHYHTLSMDEVYDYYNGKDLKDNSVVLTFDDGNLNYKTNVEPILKKYNFKATCFVIGHKTVIDSNKYLKQDDLINNETSEYYSHSYNMHHKIGKKKQLEVSSIQEIENDFNANKKIVSSTYFAYPYGKSGNKVYEVLKKNEVKLAFSYNEFRNMQRSDDKYFLPRYVIFANMPDIYFHLILN